ncbi:MAG: addiction module antitoxin [Acidimicrobiia bacterium]
MRRKMTITLDEEVYLGLHRHVGKRKISQFIEDLARPHVIDDELEMAYKEMGADEEREREAAEWVEGVVGDAADEPR